MENEFAGIEQTFELIDCIMDIIENDVDFFDESLDDIKEGVKK